MSGKINKYKKVLSPVSQQGIVSQLQRLEARIGMHEAANEPQPKHRSWHHCIWCMECATHLSEEVGMKIQSSSLLLF